MKLVFVEEKNAWAVQFKGQVVALGGTTYFDERADVMRELSTRGLFVAESGDISRLPEVSPAFSAAPERPAEAPEENERPLTPRERRERRREQNRLYRQQLSEEKRAASRKWWDEHPEKVAEYRSRFNQTRRERYATDPEYRERVKASNRAYAEKRRAKAAEAAEQATTTQQ